MGHSWKQSSLEVDTHEKSLISKYLGNLLSVQQLIAYVFTQAPRTWYRVLPFTRFFLCSNLCYHIVMQIHYCPSSSYGTKTMLPHAVLLNNIQYFYYKNDLMVRGCVSQKWSGIKNRRLMCFKSASHIAPLRNIKRAHLNWCLWILWLRCNSTTTDKEQKPVCVSFFNTFNSNIFYLSS